MVNYNACCCENCGRKSETIQVNPVTLNHHTAYLCVTCTHVFALPKNKDRFFQLVRGKKAKSSNREMQKAHQILSAFIAAGALFLVAVAAAGVAQNYDFTTIVFNEIRLTPLNEQLSFLHLKSFN
ncbi:DNA polymerase III subunit delta [Solibacillus silvestris]|uniref:DNA polymerase III subunit delta n=1 Tax=Solibacillus silvestris TaxID=76853 RepID=UPI003F81D04D